MIMPSDIFEISYRHVLRTKPWGVITSIALGIASFMILVVLGNEIRFALGKDIVLMGGVNVVMLEMEDELYPGEERYAFTNKTLDSLREIKGIEYVSANLPWSVEYSQSLGRRNIPIRFMGIDEYFLRTYSLEVAYGREITKEDIQKKRRVCMLGVEAATSLFGSAEKALHQSIQAANNDTLYVVGIVKGIMLGSWSRYGFIPYNLAIDRIICFPNWISRVLIRTQTWESLTSILPQITETVHKNQTAPHLVVRKQDEQLERLQFIFFWLSILLWLGIATALILGAFGIWTGTFASVRSRTHEIGLQKAMGAKDIDVMGQFLTEALCKAVAGGILGLLIGLGFVFIGIFYLGCDIPWVRLVLSCLGSVLFSAILGILGGLYPASTASKMDIVSALRFE
ncbi:ABC transporter permease [Desulfovibrio falkowii]|uniref:ABC transporter permease n=1 Tax=Desulfovibrio falkowii TaxID=3136602 RepID=A0ABQ0E7P1_9BACT